MLDKNVGEALLRLDLSPQAEPPVAQVERIIDADRRRVKRWTRVAIALWIFAALGAVLIFVMGALVFPMLDKMIRQENAAASSSSPKTEDAKAAKGTIDEPTTPFLVLAKLIAMCMVFGTASFMLLVLAGLATVLLLLSSRRATLRQINANLLQISEQLKPRPPGTAASGA
jgi:hypothetical protein